MKIFDRNYTELDACINRMTRLEKNSKKQNSPDRSKGEAMREEIEKILQRYERNYDAGDPIKAQEIATDQILTLLDKEIQKVRVETLQNVSDFGVAEAITHCESKELTATGAYKVQQYIESLIAELEKGEK